VTILAPPLFANSCMVVSELREVTSDWECTGYLKDVANVGNVSARKKLCKLAQLYEAMVDYTLYRAIAQKATTTAARPCPRGASLARCTALVNWSILDFLLITGMTEGGFLDDTSCY
jgi:hypothetical protein